ncbi:MAG: oligosaccharide flippase family protein [Bacteroidales bacterium]|jgi:O-antigen/teichoic acid export membrane protein|nr:oligosaccharide flippase family protein [Bacteroidales bacterium]
MGIIIRQSIKGTIATYIGTGIGIITNFFILTQFLTSEQIGLTRVLIDAASLLMSLAQLGTSSSVMRFYPHFKNSKEKDHGFFFWTLVIPFIGILLFSLLAILFKTHITSYFQKQSLLFVQYYYYIIPLAFFILYMGIFELNANVLMRITIPKFVREVVVRVALLVAYLLFAFNIISLDGLIISLSVVYAICTLFNLLYLFSLKRISLKPDFAFLTRTLKREYLFYTLFLVVAAVAVNITPYLNTFFVSGKLGLEFTGIFVIAANIVAVIEMPYRSLGAISQPAIAEVIKNGDFKVANQFSRQVSLHQFLMGGFIFTLIWINIDTLFAIMPNGEVYAAGKWVVFFLGLSRLVNSSLAIASSILNYSKFYYYSLIFTVLLTVSSILLNNFLISSYGMIGAPFATLISCSFYYILLYLFNYYKFKIFTLSSEILKIMLILGIILLVNQFCINYITPKLLLALPLKKVYILIGDSLLRTGLTIGLGIFVVYKWRISESVNGLLRKYVCRTKQ